jgi:polyphosphate kinase 2 (PPK2 family)
MSDGSASAGGKPPLRPVNVSPKKKPAEQSSSHLLGEMRHSPEMIKELFRTGKYPYKNKIRKSVYEKHKAELQVELLKVQNWV